MRDLAKRVISAIVFLILFIIAGLNQYIFGIIFSFFMLVALLELCKIALKKGLKPQKSLYALALVSFWLFFMFFTKQVNFIAIFILVALLFLIFIVELFRKDNFFVNISFYSLAFLYIIIPFSLFNFLVFYSGQFSIDLFALFFLIIWLNDIGAYTVGVSVGKHKLMPSVSPKKTIEGFIGGIVFSMFISVMFFMIFKRISLFDNLLLAFIISISATFGDLFESKLKREAGIKDSGKIMPGHGGLLDRFDSSLFSIIYLIIYWMLKN